MTAIRRVLVAVASVSAQTLTLGQAAEAALRSHPSLQAAGARVDAADQATSAARMWDWVAPATCSW